MYPGSPKLRGLFFALPADFHLSIFNKKMAFISPRAFFKGFFILFFLSALCFIGLVFLPMAQADKDNCAVVEGVLAQVNAGDGENDIVLGLKGENNHYYINRGLEKGLNLAELRSQLLGRNVMLTYIRHWSPLDPQNRTRHVAQLAMGTDTLYTEMRR